MTSLFVLISGSLENKEVLQQLLCLCMLVVAWEMNAASGALVIIQTLFSLTIPWIQTKLFVQSWLDNIDITHQQGTDRRRKWHFWGLWTYGNESIIILDCVNEVKLGRVVCFEKRIYYIAYFLTRSLFELKILVPDATSTALTVEGGIYVPGICFTCWYLCLPVVVE